MREWVPSELAAHELKLCVAQGCREYFEPRSDSNTGKRSAEYAPWQPLAKRPRGLLQTLRDAEAQKRLPRVAYSRSCGFFQNIILKVPTSFTSSKKARRGVPPPPFGAPSARRRLHVPHHRHRSRLPLNEYNSTSLRRVRSIQHPLKIGRTATCRRARYKLQATSRYRLDTDSGPDSMRNMIQHFVEAGRN